MQFKDNYNTFNLTFKGVCKLVEFDLFIAPHKDIKKLLDTDKKVYLNINKVVPGLGLWIKNINPLIQEVREKHFLISMHDGMPKSIAEKVYLALNSISSKDIRVN